MISYLKPDICYWSKVLTLAVFFIATLASANEVEIAQLEGQLKNDPENTRVHARLGRLYMRTQQLEKAISHFKSAAAAEPTPANLTSLADAYRKNRNYLDEIRTLEVLAQRQPKDASVEELIGRAYLSTNNLEKSAVHYRKAIQLDKKRLGAYEGLYDVFSKNNNNYERRALLTDVQKVFGETPEVVTKLCRFYSQDNYIEKGIELCLKAINLNPNIPDNHVFLALNYKASNEVPQSLKIIQVAAKRFSKSEFAQFTAGKMNDEIKNFETSRYFYRRCVKTDPNSDRCWGKLGQAALQLKDFQESLDAFVKACKLNSRAHYTNFRNATTTVRIQRQAQWEDKFQNAVDQCGISDH